MNCLKRCGLFCLFLFGSDAFSQSDYLFSIHGSNTIGANLVPQCASKYLASLGFEDVRIFEAGVANEYVVKGFSGRGFERKVAAIKVAAHGSSTGFKALLSGEADLAMSSRSIKPAEVEVLKHFGDMKSPAAEQAVAIDGLAILVHPQNPINNLTVRQIAQVFSGEFSNWQQLGGEDRPITLYARDNKSGTWDTFKNLVLKSQQRSLSQAAFRFESNDELSDRISSDLGAIGFAGLASVRQAKLLAVSDDNTHALMPSEFSVATEDYPLSRRLFLYVPEHTKSHFVREFVEWCQSEHGQQVVRDVGFISQNIKAFSVDASGSVDARYDRLAATARRLSVNFRFNYGSPVLDNKAYRDLMRLVHYMQQPDSGDLQLHLVGFSDAGRREIKDLSLSKLRALAVRSALMREGVAVKQSFGLGSSMPVAASGGVGKLKNGRVEVWVSRGELISEADLRRRDEQYFVDSNL